jgi:hypothetical protein
MMLVEGLSGQYYSVESPEERRRTRMAKHDPIVIDALRTKIQVIDKALQDKHAEMTALEDERKKVQAVLQANIQGE